MMVIQFGNVNVGQASLSCLLSGLSGLSYVIKRERENVRQETSQTTDRGSNVVSPHVSKGTESAAPTVLEIPNRCPRYRAEGLKSFNYTAIYRRNNLKRKEL